MGSFYADKVADDDTSGVTLVDKLPYNKYRDGPITGKKHFRMKKNTKKQCPNAV